jgi:tripartite-type tricarboxylate transporter receptor subunit TctC
MNRLSAARRRFLAVTVPALALVASGSAFAADTIRVVVPFAAGGSADQTARLIASKIAPALGKVGVVDNKSGAGGQIGLQDVIHAAPDGNTLLVTPNGPIVVSPFLQKLSYDPARDLAPVAMIAFVPSAIAVTQASPWHSLADVIAAGKANHEAIQFSVPAIGTHMHLAGELLQSVTGIALQAVPYRGTSQAAVAAASGEVPLTISDLSTLQPLAKAGRLRILALTGSRRTGTAPDIPTVAELGIEGYSADAWIGMFAPAGTPADVVGRLNAEVAKALQLPDVKQALFAAGLEPWSMPVAELKTFLASDAAKWRKVIHDANIKLDN